MRIASLLMAFALTVAVAPSAFARKYACAELDASTSAVTALSEVCISEKFVVFKPKERLADNFFYLPRLLGRFMSAREFELVPITHRGSPKGAAMRILIQPARGNASDDLVSYTVGGRVTLIGQPTSPAGQQDVIGFAQKFLPLLD